VKKANEAKKNDSRQSQHIRYREKATSGANSVPSVLPVPITGGLGAVTDGEN